MNMRVTILVFAIAGALFAQPQDQIVTNQTVAEMVRAGVAQDLIIDTISKSECRFLLDPANLVWLKNAGVADDVVRAMAAKESGKQAASPEFTQAKTPSPSVPTASRASLTPQLAQTPPPRAGSPRIYIESQGGFESYLSAAMVKKHVPAVVTQNKDEAMFALTSAVQSKKYWLKSCTLPLSLLRRCGRDSNRNGSAYQHQDARSRLGLQCPQGVY
jgi:hypothetical protein